MSSMLIWVYPLMLMSWEFIFASYWRKQNPSVVFETGDTRGQPTISSKVHSPEVLLTRKSSSASLNSLPFGAAAVIVIGVIAITVLILRVWSSASRSAAALALSGGDDHSHSPTTNANSSKLVMFSGDPDFSMGAHVLLNKDCELEQGGPTPSHSEAATLR